jgi:DNA repair photolyase
VSEKYSPDQPIVKGADVIYRPAGNAGEYAPLATNPYRSCGHACKYCYVPGATHVTRAEFNKPGVLRDGYLERLEVDAKRHGRAGLDDIQRQIFITFSSDPWHPGDNSPTTKVLDILVNHGLAFCTLTKSGAAGRRDIGFFRPALDAFAASMTSLDDDFSLKWEPYAALPAERMAGLRAFHDRGVFTWVSIEPTLDVDHSMAVINATHEFVDLYKVGRANYLQEITRTTDWRGYTLRVTDLLQKLGKAHYIKADLQPHLPSGYHNPLRVAQHRGVRP